MINFNTLIVNTQYFAGSHFWLSLNSSDNKQRNKQAKVSNMIMKIPGGGGGGGTQMLFGRGCAAEASKPVPIFKGHFGGKGYPLLGVWRKRVPIIRDF